MGTILKIQRKDLDQTRENYDECCKVVPGDTDKREDVARFKYAAGKNANALRALVKEVAAKVQSLHFGVPAMAAYRKEAQELASALADRDDAGDPKVDPETDSYVITENLEAFKAAIDSLKEQPEHAEALAEQAKMVEQIDAYLEEEVAVAIFTVPFAIVPDRIGGAYVDLITPMLTDCPDMDGDES